VESIRNAPDETLGGTLRFAEADAELTQAHKEKLHRTAALLRGKTQKIDIRGHTSPLPLPLDSPYRSRWDLAYARCYQTMDYLIKLGIDRRRIHISLMADNEPVGDGSPEPQANDRVEILMLDSFMRKQPTGVVEGLPEETVQNPRAEKIL
jgi:flagellar motor protein MotB